MSIDSSYWILNDIADQIMILNILKIYTIRIFLDLIKSTLKSIVIFLGNLTNNLCEIHVLLIAEDCNIMYHCLHIFIEIILTHLFWERLRMMLPVEIPFRNRVEQVLRLSSKVCCRNKILHVLLSNWLFLTISMKIILNLFYFFFFIRNRNLNIYLILYSIFLVRIFNGMKEISSIMGNWFFESEHIFGESMDFEKNYR